MVVLAALLLVFVATHTVGGGAVSLTLDFQPPTRAYHLVAGALAGEPGRIGLSSGQVTFDRPSVSFVLLAGLVMAVAAAAWLFIVSQFRGLLGALRTGAPFASTNELRVRRIGVTVIAFAFGQAVLAWGAGLFLEHSMHADGITLDTHFALDVPVVLLGVVLLALSAVFRAGIELAEDQALTI